MAAAPPRGMPILSGPPPLVESSSCRQCGRDFNPLWRRGKACGHCGYEYCSTCLSDGQALMPRTAQRPASGPLAEIRDAFRAPSVTGYDVEPVCLHCLSMLQVTAAPVDILRSLPLKRLREYLKAYDISIVGVKEKEDLVEAAVKARNPATGTLSPEHESFFRRRSVPRQGGAGNAGAGRRQPSSGGQQARPNTGTQGAQERAYAYSYNNPMFPRPPPPQGRPPPPTYANQNTRPPPPQNTRPPPSQPRTQTNTPTPQAQPTQAAPRPPPPPVPTILSLVALPNSYLSTLSIGTLKAILYENHVRVDFKQVLEKSELISRVSELVAHERRRLERQRLEEDREAREAEAAAARAAAARHHQEAVNGHGDQAQGEGAAVAGDSEHPPMEVDEGANLSTSPGASNLSTSPHGIHLSPSPALDPSRVPTGPSPDVDRGLCVVCQDEEATLAVVDCGHLAMCQHCSDLVMATSRECPLCRTRIVTPQRLIRIYRV